MIKLKDILNESNTSTNYTGVKGYKAFLPSEKWNSYVRKLNTFLKRTTGYIIKDIEKLPPDTIKKIDNLINKEKVSDKDISEISSNIASYGADAGEPDTGFDVLGVEEGSNNTLGSDATTQIRIAG